MGLIKNNIHKIYLAIIVVLISYIVYTNDMIKVSDNAICFVYGNGEPNISFEKKEDK